MFLLKLLQSIFSTLHSEGTPGQVAAGMALGAFLGLTPLMSFHNLIVFALICLLNVSFGGAMIGWAVFTPVGFLLDPLFDSMGHRLLLDTPSLTGLWTTLYNAPVFPLTNFNNTVVLGSLLFSTICFLPFFFFFRWGVDRYRATAGAWLMKTKLYHVVTASKLVNVYKWFRP
ncbi:MAG TPA: TIGR03546 family protein [Gemmatimonadales bacterium]|nr:TIGR03546 family protein [Gemmatimonadales bacterium]